MSERTVACLRTLERSKLVCVVRMHRPASLVPLMKALYDGGVSIIEITATTPGWNEQVDRIREQFSGHDDVFVGAGTILDREQLDLAIRAGADFAVSPVFDPELTHHGIDAGIPMMPGCMTPTEIHAAWKAGASVVKTFPGRVCTPEFYRDLRGPLPDVKMMPTGNVDTNTAPQYIAAGAIAVGVGKALASEDEILGGKWADITAHARTFRQALGL